MNCYLEVRAGTISWATACHLGRSAVGHRHSKPQAGGRPWKPRGQSHPLHRAGPSWATCETKRYKIYIVTRTFFFLIKVIQQKEFFLNVLKQQQTSYK